MSDHDAKMEAQRKLREHPHFPEVGRIYRHYKGGLYQCTSVGIKEDTLEPMVGYLSLHYCTTSYRTLEDWSGLVEQPNGKQLRRFVLLEFAV